MKILAIIDAQNDFITGVLGSAEAVAARDNMVQWLRDYDPKDTVTLFTKDTHYEDYLDTQEGKLLPVKHCMYGTSGWSIDKKVSGEVDYGGRYALFSTDTAIKGRINKSTFGSEYLVRLLDWANEMDRIEEIIVMGFCTDICVISNVLLMKTFLPEIKITVVANCCAGTTPENHEAALKIMQSCQVKIID